jgi:hypothetical protein
MTELDKDNTLLCHSRENGNPKRTCKNSKKVKIIAATYKKYEMRTSYTEKRRWIPAFLTTHLQCIVRAGMTE